MTLINYNPGERNRWPNIMFSFCYYEAFLADIPFAALRRLKAFFNLCKSGLFATFVSLPIRFLRHVVF